MREFYILREIGIESFIWPWNNWLLPRESICNLTKFVRKRHYSVLDLVKFKNLVRLPFLNLAFGFNRDSNDAHFCQREINFAKIREQIQWHVFAEIMLNKALFRSFFSTTQILREINFDKIKENKFDDEFFCHFCQNYGLFRYIQYV